MARRNTISNKITDNTFSAQDKNNRPALLKKNRATTRNAPAVSVCMSIYNASQFLKACIESILCQTFKDFELLIVDDGSTDNSRDIVRAYNDPRIRLMENKHNYIKSLNLSHRLNHSL